jgi:quercetin dioxygenase-like cupin family protein
MKENITTLALLGSLLSMQTALAANPAPATKPTETLQRISVNGTNRQMGMGIAVFPPYAEKPRHKAIGPEIAYVMAGEVTVFVEGQPPRTVHAGESYQVAADDIHITKAGPKGATTIASWVTIPGQEFNVPMPK